MSSVLLFLNLKQNTTHGTYCSYFGVVDGESYTAYGYPDSDDPEDMNVYPGYLTQAVKSAITIVRKDGKFDSPEFIDVEIK
jgi:hypothetical protein